MMDISAVSATWIPAEKRAEFRLCCSALAKGSDSAMRYLIRAQPVHSLLKAAERESASCAQLHNTLGSMPTFAKSNAQWDLTVGTAEHDADTHLLVFWPSDRLIAMTGDILAFRNGGDACMWLPYISAAAQPIALALPVDALHRVDDLQPLAIDADGIVSGLPLVGNVKLVGDLTSGVKCAPRVRIVGVCAECEWTPQSQLQ